MWPASDEPFDELPAGEVGEVLVGHGFFPSYRNKPDRFAETTQGGVLHTGDLAVADPDGFIMVLGRTGEAASAAARGGFLRELEDALYAHPAVLHAAVVDRGDGELAGLLRGPLRPRGHPRRVDRPQQPCRPLCCRPS